jgi:ATP-dependent DNA ligase
MKYQNYKYIYPCRPANAINPEELNEWDNSTMLAQLKFNGSNCIIFTNGDIVRVMGRHCQLLSNFTISKDEIINSLYKPLGLNGNWIVLNGECLNKSKRDENTQVFNGKFIIFDILVFDSIHLIGKSFLERVELLEKIYGKNQSEKEYLWSISENCYLAKTYFNGFSDLYKNFSKIDLIEGLVLKRKMAKLESGTTEKNNWRSQVKARKSTLNYKY